MDNIAYSSFLSDINFSIFLADIKSQINTVAQSFVDIEKHIEAINISMVAPLWEKILNHSLTGVFIGVILALVPQWYRDHYKKLCKINAALASFENTRITLLTLKGQFLKPYRKDMSCILWKYINHLRNEKLPKLTKNDDYTLPNHEEIIKSIRPDWEKMSEPFTFWQQQIFYQKSWGEELGFLASHYPEFLVTIHKAYEHLTELNQFIEKRNNLIQRYREKSIYEGTLHSIQIRESIHQHWDFAKNFKMIIDTSLGFNQLCVKHIEQYAKEYFYISLYFRYKRLFKFKLTTAYEALMLNIEDSLGDYPKQIQESIKAHISKR